MSIGKRKRWTEKIVEKLKDWPASPRDFMSMGIPERSVFQTLKGLKSEGKITQKVKRGKYFLPGYENGPPNRGRQTVIKKEYLCRIPIVGMEIPREIEQ